MLLRYYSEREKKQREGKEKYKERKKYREEIKKIRKINRKREYIYVDRQFTIWRQICIEKQIDSNLSRQTTYIHNQFLEQL